MEGFCYLSFGGLKYFDLLRVTARALSFAMEFIVVAAQGDTPPTWKQAQQVVRDRLVQLAGNIAIGMRYANEKTSG